MRNLSAARVPKQPLAQVVYAKKPRQEHDAPKRQVGCSEQLDCVFQGRHICFVFQRNDPVSIFVLLLQSITQLGHRNHCSFVRPRTFARTLAKRYVVDASFIWTASTLSFHTVLPRARWTGWTNRSPHSCMIWFPWCDYCCGNFTESPERN